LPRPETQGFTRNIANRLWALLFGRGLVHPLDLHHPANQPSHPELLERLEQWLVDNQYDTRGLLREIALSQTYQRSSILPQGVRELPDDTFAVARLRGMSAEQFSWSVLQSLGRIEGEMSTTEAARQSDTENLVEASSAWKLRAKHYESLERHARSFSMIFAGLPGQPEGDIQCSVDQALYLLNSPNMLSVLQNESNTLLGRLMAIPDGARLAEELYLSVLSRRADADETEEVVQFVEPITAPAERRELLAGLIWGLILSSEFRLIH
jgi:hypothetical protein